MRGKKVHALLVAGLLLAGACSDDEGEDSGASTTEAEGSTDGTGDGSTTTEGDDTGGEGDQVAEAEARLAEHLAPPTSFADREPLSAPIEPGQELIFLRCSLPVCSSIAASFQDAAEAVGWSVSVIDFSSTDPESVIASFNQAVDAAPDGIAITGVPATAYEEPLQRAKDAGIPVAIGAVAGVEVGGMDGNGIIANVSSVNNSLAAAAMVADYVIADSGGEANVAIFTVEDFPIVKAQTDGVAEYIEANCDGCSARIVNQAVADIGTVVPGAVVSVLQEDPSIDYVYFGFGDLSRGVAPAIADAGFDAKLVGYGPFNESYQRLIDGEEAAWAGASNRATGWDLVDGFARYFAGDDLSDDRLQLLQLFTADSPPSSDDPGIPENFEDLYLELWGVE